MSGRTLVPFTLQDDLGGPGSYGLAATDQRHRAVFNGIWEVGRGFQVSGLHYLGAGIRSATSYGGDVRADGRHLQRASASGRHDRPAQRIHPAGAEPNRHPRAAADSAAEAACRSTRIAEVFNVFNRTNYTVDTVESSATYLTAGRRDRTAPAQVGFRLTF